MKKNNIVRDEAQKLRTIFLESRSVKLLNRFNI